MWLSHRFPEKRLTVCSVTVEWLSNVMDVVCNDGFFSPSLTCNCRLLTVPMGAMTEVFLERYCLNTSLPNLY